MLDIGCDDVCCYITVGLMDKYFSFAFDALIDGQKRRFKHT